MQETLSKEVAVVSNNGSEAKIRVDDIHINSDLQAFITPLAGDTKQQLEENIKTNGCLDPLTVWEKNSGEKVLVDGHNRFDICQRNDIDFKVRLVRFGSKEEAKDWMLNHQLGRRNLNPDQLSYFRGLKYERMKKKRGGYDKVLSSGQSGDKTSEILAKEFNVSDRTILRDAEFAKGVEVIARTNPGLKNDILLGNVKVKKGDVQLLAQEKNMRQIGKIKNAADLYNKAQAIRKKRDEEKIKREIEEEDARVDAAAESLRIKDPVFATKEERMNRIKGNIISGINKSIQHKDKKAWMRMQKYLHDLEEELFGKYAKV